MDQMITTITILDWCDTLFPTTDHNNAQDKYKKETGVQGLYDLVEYMGLSDELTKKYQKVEQCAIALITQAKKYGPVYIITNAEADWIRWCCKYYYKTIKQTLDTVTMISARDLNKPIHPNDIPRWKYLTITNLLSDKNDLKQIINVTDAEMDRISVREAVNHKLEQLNEKQSALYIYPPPLDDLLKTKKFSICLKNIKMTDTPTIDQLIIQLTQLTKSFDKITIEPTSLETTVPLTHEANHHQIAIIGSGIAAKAVVESLETYNLTINCTIFKDPNNDIIETYQKIPNDVIINEDKFITNAKIINQSIKSINNKTKPYSITTSTGDVHTADAIIIASTTNHIGEQLPNKLDITGLYNCTICDKYKLDTDLETFKNKHITILGNDDQAAKMALKISQTATKVILISNTNSFQIPNIMRTHLETRPNIILMNNTRIKTIISSMFNTKRTVLGVIVSIVNNDKNSETLINTDAIIACTRHKPMTDFLKGTNIQRDKEGYILTTINTIKGTYITETNIEGIFACGSITDRRHNTLMAILASCSLCAIDVSRFLSNKPKPFKPFKPLKPL